VFQDNEGVNFLKKKERKKAEIKKKKKRQATAGGCFSSGGQEPQTVSFKRGRRKTGIRK